MNKQIWCYKTDCENCANVNTTDKDGAFGECDKEILIIDKEGKCDEWN